MSNSTSKTLTPEEIEAKRTREREVVTQMISVYCRGNHGTARGQLCEDCTALTEYASTRISRCPFMATKTFCSQCRVHCYAPAQRQAIKDVMRYAGPRMLLHHPVMTVRHGLDTLAAKRRKKEQGEA